MLYNETKQAKWQPYIFEIITFLHFSEQHNAYTPYQTPSEKKTRNKNKKQ